MPRATNLVVLLAVTILPVQADPLVVTPSTDGAALVAELLGPGITVVPGSINYTGATNQGGFFSGGTGILPFDSGILLTSGSVFNAVGPNNAHNASANVGTAGDAGLNSVIPGFTTFDANILQFSFIPAGNEISFQYVFGSEEYNEAVMFDDVFAAFLNGVNIALVSVHNVNCGNPSYRQNSNDPGCPVTPLLNIQYDGIVGGLGSLALFATGPVNPGVENTIRLAIADASDHDLDSGVFLKASSFAPQSAPIPEPGTFLLLGAAVAGSARRKLLRKH